MDAKVLEELKRLLADAFTGRPWSVDPDPRVKGSAQIIHEKHGRIATTVAFMSTGRHNPCEEDDADAALIVAAVNALPALIAVAERNEQLERLREAVGEYLTCADQTAHGTNWGNVLRAYDAASIPREGWGGRLWKRS